MTGYLVVIYGVYGGKGVTPSESRPAAPTPSRDDEEPKPLKLSNALAAVIQQDEERREAFP